MDRDALPLFLVLLVIPLYLIAFSSSTQLPFVPGVGWNRSFLACLFPPNIRSTVETGYAKYRDSPFKLLYFRQWMVVITKPSLLEELRRANENDLSQTQANDEVYQKPYTLGAPTIHYLERVMPQLTRNLQTLLPELGREALAALWEKLPNTSDWRSLQVDDIASHITGRVVARVLVGQTLSTNTEYTTLAVLASNQTATSAVALSRFPRSFRRLAYFFTSIHWRKRRLRKFLLPVVQAKRKECAGVDRRQQSDDLISLLLNEFPEITDSELVRCVLNANFEALHTISKTLVDTMYQLSTHPQCIPVVREEIHSSLHSEGWTMASIERMSRLDSLLKETMRLSSIRTLTVMRTVRGPLPPTLAAEFDSPLPIGTVLCAGTSTIHHDAQLYTSPDEFHPFRFSHPLHDIARARAGNERYDDLAERGDEPSPRNQLVAASPTFLAWGYGKHACPGRFLAGAIMKVIIGEMVLRWDIRKGDVAGVSSTSVRKELGLISWLDENAVVEVRKRN